MSDQQIDGDDVERNGAGQPTRVRGEFRLPVADAAGDAIVGFLQANADTLQLPPDEKALEVVHEADTPSGRVVRLRQQFEGKPVLDSEVLVVVDNDARVTQIDLDIEPQPKAVQVSGDSELKPRDAVKAAKDAIGPHTLRGKAPSPTQVYARSPEGLRLAYLVLLPTTDPHDWRIVVDAQTGEILEQRDLIVQVDGQGMVFDPNPVVTANNAALRDPDATAGGCGFAGTARATIDAQRVTRTLRDITLDGANHRLEGPFARIQNFGAPASTLPSEAGANDFNYSSGDERFEAVNVYYHVDTFQRYLQDATKGPGITTAHNSPIACDPHDGSGGAWFSPLDLGLHFGNSGSCRPDRAEDGHVMLHEYGHAIQNNQVPGWGVTSPVTGRAETRAIGEGYGDALACIFFADHGGGFQREVFEQWIFGDVGGLRRVDGTKVYPGSWVPDPAEHANGEIWSAALWNVYRAIGGDSASAAVRAEARHAMIKTVTLSNHRMTASGTMPDAAEAVMSENAALDAYRGRHLMQMLDSFHARGLLPCSPQANLTITDGPTFWNSPDLWIRNNDDPVTSTTHQAPEFGQDNWFYARVRNTGTAAARAFVVTFNVKPWAGTEFVYPNDFIAYVSAAVGFNLAPGASTVVKAKWPAGLVPPAGTHACWLASVYTPVDTTAAGMHVWEHDNLAQKNLTVVDLAPNDAYIVPFQLGNLASVREGLFRIEVQRPPNWRSLPVAIVHRDPAVVRQLVGSIEEVRVRPNPLVGRGALAEGSPFVRFLEPTSVEIAHRGALTAPVRLNLGRDSSVELEPAADDNDVSDAVMVNEADLVTDRDQLTAMAFRPGLEAGFPFQLRPRSAVSAGLKITVPREAKPGETMSIDLVQRNRAGKIVGGIAVQVNVVDK